MDLRCLTFSLSTLHINYFPSDSFFKKKKTEAVWLFSVSLSDIIVSIVCIVFKKCIVLLYLNKTKFKLKKEANDKCRLKFGTERASMALFSFSSETIGKWLTRNTIYKDLWSVRGVDRITVWYHEAGQVMPDSIARDWVFYLPLTPMIDSFSCTSFISERRLFNNAVTSIAYVRYIVMTLLLRLMTSLHSVT